MNFVENYRNRISNFSVSFTSMFTDEFLNEVTSKYDSDCVDFHVPVRLYTSYEYSFPGKLKYTLRSMECYAFVYVIEGSIAISSDSDKNCLISDNGFIFIDCSNSYSLNAKTDSRLSIIYFYGEYIKTYYKTYKNYRGNTPVIYPGFDSCISKNLSAICALPKELTPSLSFMPVKYVTDILTELCVKEMLISRIKEQIPDYLVKIRQRFDNDYEDSFYLEDFEFLYGIDKYRICREFRKFYGMAPIHYLNNVRIERAAILLTTTRLTIHEIGADVGIDNTNHFINLFKKSTGKTPFVYRQDALEAFEPHRS